MDPSPLVERKIPNLEILGVVETENGYRKRFTPIRDIDLINKHLVDERGNELNKADETVDTDSVKLGVDKNNQNAPETQRILILSALKCQQYETSDLLYLGSHSFKI